MALRSKYNETQTSLHALHDLAQVQLLPWSHQAHGPPFLPSICCPLPGMLFPQASHLHLLHVIAVSAHLSPPQKGLLWPAWRRQPLTRCSVSYDPVSFLFTALLPTCNSSFTRNVCPHPLNKTAKTLGTGIWSCLLPVLKHSWPTVGTHK